MVRAFASLLAAAGLEADHPELDGTPERAAAAWADEFIDGYRVTVPEALGALSIAPKGGGFVVVTGLDYTGVCPHHLLPYRGVAHVAYQPRKHIAGFGRLAVLVDALAHRLTLQETLAEQLSDALVQGLGAAGAAVILDAEQSCMSMRGERRARSRTVVEATTGKSGAAVLESLRAAVKKHSPKRPR